MNKERVILIATETKDCFGIAYGFRIFDSLSQGSDFLSEKKFEETPEGDIELLKYAWEKHHDISEDPVSRIFDYIKKHHFGIQINKTWYDYDQIKDYLV
ncbi:MAG: hypothetical protein M0R32_02625 [Candidatus Cloacimonetes bacterium]|jgi:hypothetical protein|nr:hypothetical protein [Candidatus Cloacimonadota bacterium]